MTAVFAALAAAALGWWARRAVARARTTHDRRRAAVTLPGAVADLARSVRAGATLEVAVRELAPTTDGVLGTELRGAVTLLDRGHGVDRVLDLWGRATRIEGVSLLVAACRFSIGRTVALERALDGVAAALLDRVEVGDEVRALAAQARTSAIVLVALPPAGAVLFGLLDPGFASVVAATTAGRVCVALGLALDGAGALASRALVRRAVEGPARPGRRRPALPWWEPAR
ncbi:type II secretion system F family protein [Dermatobacter hominis]|uniref:type II secretion system F family protein n=1 Tax=Dermatobacter hominis TaxID=2884263 RepID=UPI001D12645C|nr:type II secretion system F family protein [Dermatobacter hominis]UDY34417.1 type II secretion system F family protein [Dermatobacter hominis]